MTNETSSTTQDSPAPAAGPGGWDAPGLALADPGRRYATLLLMRGALVALGINLLAGLLAVLYSIPGWSGTFQSLGLDFTALRPLHTVFAASWIFLAGLAMVHRYLQDEGGRMTDGDRWRTRIQLVCWAIAGAGILVSLSLGVTSGREYMGFHPIFSIPIVLGWLLFAWNFFRITGPGFFQRPVYVTMWGVGCLFFLWTFTEQHLWLLPEIFSDPVVDRRIQWKATGTLVGSFNLFMYGSLLYLGEKLSGDKGYGHCHMAWALFGLGLLNSFTNFAHHTYHLPQSHLVKWIAFVVSMTEMIILFRVVWEIGALVMSRESRPYQTVRSFLVSAKWWTAAMLFSSILLSVPPLNALVHGTYAVTGHAMGTMIGIDTFVLLGALTAILGEMLVARGGHKAAEQLDGPRVRRIVVGLNLGVGGLIGWLTFVGCMDGYHRYLTPRDQAYALVRPEWITSVSPVVFAVTGTIAFLFLASLLHLLLPLVFQRFQQDVVVGD